MSYLGFPPAASPLTEAQLSPGDARFRRLDGSNIGAVGLRNKIINGDFRINQRGAASKSQSAGVYGYDRWKGHADGLEQIVEAANMPAGTYVLSWEGGGNGRLNGGALLPSPITATIPGNAHVSVVVPATAENVQLEEGPVATPFERRPIGLELALCQRYFEVFRGDENPMAFMGVGQVAAANRAVVYLPFMVRKRANPTVSYSSISDWSFFNASVANYVQWQNASPQVNTSLVGFDVTTTTASFSAAGDATLLTPYAATSNARIFIDAEL